MVQSVPRVERRNIGKCIPNVTSAHQSVSAREVLFNIITQMLMSSPWELHFPAIFWECLGDSNRCLTCVQTQISSLPVQLCCSAGSRSPQGFWDISQPISVLLNLFCMPHAARAAYVVCEVGRLLNDLTRLSCVTWDVRSTVDGVFTESLLKVVLLVSSVAPLLKNLRQCLMIIIIINNNYLRHATPNYLPLITTSFAQAEAHLLGTVHLIDINSCKQIPGSCQPTCQIRLNHDLFSALTRHPKSFSPHKTFIGNPYLIASQL